MGKVIELDSHRKEDFPSISEDDISDVFRRMEEIDKELLEYEALDKAIGGLKIMLNELDTFKIDLRK